MAVKCSFGRHGAITRELRAFAELKAIICKGILVG